MESLSLYKAVPMSRKKIAQIAALFRKFLQLEDTLYVDVLKILEYVMPVLGYNYEIPEIYEMDEEALTHTDEKTILIRRDVYDGARKGIPRYRFTIMHEIGHAILHVNPRISFARGSNIKPYENPEWQADVFAGEFLVPMNLTAGMTAEQISQACGVSLKAANVQIAAHNKSPKSVFYN